jgi:transcriptional regulator with XRE-family HTH domain
MKVIANMRTIRGLTQGQLALLAGLSRSHLSEIESGKKSPSLSCLRAIATQLEIADWELLFIESHSTDLMGAVSCLLTLREKFDASA